MRRAAVLHGLLAAIATLGAAGAMSTIMDDGAWSGPLALAVLTILAAGVVLRWLRAPLAVTAVLQAALGLGTIAATFAGDTFAHGVLPTRETLAELGGQFRTGLHLMFTYQAPLLHSRAVDLLIATAMAVTAVATDLLACRRRQPVLAGAPLVWPFLLCAVARPDSWVPWPFVVAALPWVTLLGLEGMHRARSWSSLAARSGAPAASTEDRGGLHRYGAAARAVALTAVAAAALLPIYVPVLGLGGDHGPAGNGDGGTVTATGSRVRFLDTMDLRKDLTDRSRRPVLRYRTNDAEPPPLKVMSTAVYRDGRWSRAVPGATTAAGGAAVPPAPGLDSTIPAQSYQITVEDNALQRPYVAVPAYATALRSRDAVARYDSTSGHLLVDRTPLRYVASYSRPRPRTAPTEPVAPSAPGVSPQDLAFEGPFVDTVRAEAAQAVGSLSTPLEKATAMQTYLRTPGRFRYSLTLDPAPGAADPLSAFVKTRVGYCVQFATLMVMMARSEGIPARMAYGFLPGALDADGRRTVTPADAHAWPELYIPQLGWVRFEATPSARTGAGAPTYTRVVLSTQTRETAVPTSAPTTSAPAPAAPAEGPGRERVDARPLVPALVVLLLAALLALTPLRTRAARARRRADEATTYEDLWESLLARLRDLGISRPAPESPRRMGAALATSLHTAEDKARLGSLVDGLEAHRYRPPGSASAPGAEAWSAHDALVASARSSAAWRARVRAVLWPADRPRLRRRA